MDTEHQLQLAQYVSQMREAGSNDEVIRQELLRTGWQASDIDSVLPAQRMQPHFDASREQLATIGGGYRPTRRPLIMLVLITAVVSLVVGAVIGFAVKPDKVAVKTIGGTGTGTTQETYAKFSDKNFSIELAKSWSVDGTYTDGKTPISFYSSEYNTLTTTGSGARMTISKTDAKPAQDEIASALAGFTSTGVSYTILRDNISPDSGSGSKRVVELTRSLKQQPGKTTHVIYMVIDAPSKKHYYVEVSADDTAWKQRHADTITRMINSFTPL
jgi:hypothetical protein